MMMMMMAMMRMMVMSEWVPILRFVTYSGGDLQSPHKRKENIQNTESHWPPCTICLGMGYSGPVPGHYSKARGMIVGFYGGTLS